jgi:hypothetical protein
MQGDIDRPDEAVLTKSDYERYDEKRKLFSVQLRGDLVSKTFAFVCLSFTDPTSTTSWLGPKPRRGEPARPPLDRNLSPCPVLT